MIRDFKRDGERSRQIENGQNWWRNWFNDMKQRSSNSKEELTLKVMYFHIQTQPDLVLFKVIIKLNTGVALEGTAKPLKKDSRGM